MPDWAGETVVVVGGGPSLSLEQVRIVALAHFKGHCKVVAVNSSAFVVWWADWWHGFSAKWLSWLEAARRFPGHKTVCDDCLEAESYATLAAAGVERVEPAAEMVSGGQAIHLVMLAGAGRIVLVAFDGEHDTAGHSHWHAASSLPLGDTWSGSSISGWTFCCHSPSATGSRYSMRRRAARLMPGQG